MAIPREDFKLKQLFKIMSKNFLQKRTPNLKKIKQLTDLEKSYLAGLIDAAGCIYAKIVRANYRTYKFAIRVDVSVNQKINKRWFLIKLQKKLGCGSLNIATADSSETKTIDKFTLNSMPLVKGLLLELRPYLRLKKTQAELAILIVDLYYKQKSASKFEFIKLCKIVDKLTELNDSEKYLKKNLITGTTVEKELLADNSVM
jgi:hypothetical protein